MISIWIILTTFIWKANQKIDIATVVMKLNDTRQYGGLLKYGKYTIEIQQPINDDKLVTSSGVSQRKAAIGRGWVTVHRIGRLGNNMFQFAALIAVAKHNNMTPIYPNETLDGIFNIDRSGNLPHKENNNSFPVTNLNENKSSVYDVGIMKIVPANTNIRLCCYFQSWKYLVEIQKDLKKQFTFHSSIDTLALAFIDEVRKDMHGKDEITNGTRDMTKRRGDNHVTLIGIHIRRTDMADTESLNPNKGYVVAPKHYFQKAMEYFRTKFKYVHFIVCSDDIFWAQINIRSSSATFSIGHSPGEDLAILSHCDHIIMSTGSFSWWAGWLSGGEVIYYAGWPRPNSELAQRFERFDYFLPQWKAML
ncbi:unnamed protein product [Owenia fusiformis]|uniref:L-Fucosyltransferase n=1 Tax=Owenia fusiformis TaxID=6347 RepID=A0A8J1TX30_OWEFU|nr:unnamed protein product [Owenia fusiformis]